MLIAKVGNFRSRIGGQGVNRDRRKSNWGISSFFAVCAVLSALAPIHPSMQPVWLDLGIPSVVGVIVLFGLAFLHYILRPVLSRQELKVFLPFFVYLVWMSTTSFFSPAVGITNWWKSIQSLLLVLPVMLMAACMGARNSVAASRAVIACGVVAAIHFLYRLGAGTAGGEDVGGFGAIAVIDGFANYQSTAFYIGILGIWAFTLLEYRKHYMVTGISLLFVTVALIGATGARSSLVGLIGVATILLGRSRGWRLMALVLIGLVAVIVFVALGFFLNSPPIDVGAQNFPVIYRFQVLFDDDDSSYRLRLFSSAIAMWLESPGNFFFGGGLAAYPLFAGLSGEDGWYPHNFVLESLAEGGLIASLPLGVILLWLVRAGFRNSELNLDFLFLRNFALFSCLSYMFMGGVETIWIPFFGISLYLFSIKPMIRGSNDF